MTLRQEVEELIAQWQGSDAMERASKRQQLVDDLIALMKRKTDRKPARRPAPAQTAGNWAA